MAISGTAKLGLVGLWLSHYRTNTRWGASTSLNSNHCASSIPKIPSTNLFFQPHPPNADYASFLILYSTLESHAKGSLFASALALFVEGPGHEENLRWSNSKVNSGPGNTYSPDSRVCIHLECKTTHNGKIWPVLFYWCGPFKNQTPSFP
jgi:hypothetical protein